MNYNEIHVKFSFPRVWTHTVKCVLRPQGQGWRELNRKREWGTAHSGTSGATIECVNTARVWHRTNLTEHPLVYSASAFISQFEFQSFFFGIFFLLTCKAKWTKKKSIHSYDPCVLGRKSSKRLKKCWTIFLGWRRSTGGFTISPANTTASSGTTHPITRMHCATSAVWTSRTSQVRQRAWWKWSLVTVRWWWLRVKSCCLHRDREAGEGLHAGARRSPRRRSLQLWRAGEIPAAPFVLCINIS